MIFQKKLKSKEKIFLDGGNGSEIARLGGDMSPAFAALATINSPDLVIKVHENFINAGCDIITANTNLAASEIELAEVKNREFVLLNILSKIEGYDYILIDCPPALGLLTINALVASHSIIIPLQSEFFALEGISSLVNSIELIKENFNPNLVIEGILLTMVDKRNSLSSLVEKDVRDHFGETVYKTTIPRNVRISEAPSHGKPAILYDVNCTGSMAYIGLAREIINKEGVMNEQR